MAHGINSVLSNESCSITARNTSAKGSVVTKTGIGSRRIFPAHFKLQVLDSYRNDADCKGNQRATARKYGIHRRQIQKWLQVEPNLRNSVVISANATPSGGGKHQQAKIVVENAMKSGFEEVSLKTPPPLQQCCRLRDDSAPEAYAQQSQSVSVGASEMVVDVAAVERERERQREEARVPSSSPDAYSECCYSPTASHSHSSRGGDELPLDFTTHSRWYAGRHHAAHLLTTTTPTTILYPSSSNFQSADQSPCSPYYHSISSMTSSPISSHQYEDTTTTTTTLLSSLSSSTTTTSPLDLSVKPQPHSNNDDVTHTTTSYLYNNNNTTATSLQHVAAGSQLSIVDDDDSCPMSKGDSCQMLLVEDDRSRLMSVNINNDVNSNDCCNVVWDLSMKDNKAAISINNRSLKRERESDDSDNNNVSKPKPVKLFKPYLLDDTSSNSSSTTTSTSTTCKIEEEFKTTANSTYSNFGYNSSGLATPQTSNSHHYNVTIYNNCYNSPCYNNNAHLSTDYSHSSHSNNNNIYTVPNCSNSPPFYYGYNSTSSNLLLYPGGDYGNNNNNASNSSNTSVAIVPLKQRQSYSVDFKLRAINAYYRDDGCRGNQRAVAHKYNIHRRQIQKWLKQEEELRLRKTSAMMTTTTTLATSFASIVR